MDTVVKELIEKVMELPDENIPLLVAVDGRCASGKTTLATRLNEAAGWSVFHMDDFFLRVEQRTKARLSTPGGNVDYERFLEEVLVPLKNGNTNICYSPFDCHKQSLKEPVYTKAGNICLIEGAYSCHLALWDFYNLRVFLTIDPGEQERRIIKRNGIDAAETFINRWIPMEERYFAVYQVEKRCDLCFNT